MIYDKNIRAHETWVKEKHLFLSKASSWPTFTHIDHSAIFFSSSLLLPFRASGRRGPALRHPRPSGHEPHHPELPRQRQPRHAADQRQRQVLRVHAEGGDQRRRAGRRAGQRDATEGDWPTERKSCVGRSWVWSVWTKQPFKRTSLFVVGEGFEQCDFFLVLSKYLFFPKWNQR